MIRRLVGLFFCLSFLISMCGCSGFFIPFPEDVSISQASSLQQKVISPEEMIPVRSFKGSQEFKAVAFGDFFWIWGRETPSFLYLISAETGQRIKTYQLLFYDKESPVFHLKTYSDCVVAFTDRLAFCFSSDGTILAQREIPEGIQQISDIDRSLRYLLCEDGVDISRYDLETDNWEKVVVGNLETFPQELYSQPCYVCEDQKLLMYQNIGSEQFAPLLFDLETMSFLDLRISFDLHSSYRLQQDQLLISDGIQTTLVEPEANAVPEGNYFGEEERIRVTGFYDFLRNQFQQIGLVSESFGVQNWAMNSQAVYFFQETDEGQNMYLYHLSSRDLIDTNCLLEVSNLQVLAAGTGDKLLIAYYDLQDNSNNGVGILDVSDLAH